MNPSAILALISDLYGQIQVLLKTNADLQRQVSEQDAELVALRHTHSHTEHGG